MLSDKREHAARLVRLAIHAVAREAFGSPAVTRPIPGLSSTHRDVEALPGLRAAVLARDVATRCVRNYAAQARGEGHSWDAIAGALGLGDDYEDPRPGERAFLHVAADASLATEDPHWGRPVSTNWLCASCGQYVTDHGPFDADPASTEEGHAPECARHNTEITSYLAGWGDER